MEKDYKRSLRRHYRECNWNRRLKDCWNYYCYHNGSEIRADGSDNPPYEEITIHNWKDLKQFRYFNIFKTTGMPCSCPMCSGEHYSRKDFKKETKRILKEDLFDNEEN